jgi:hypothetical protein
MMSSTAHLLVLNRKALRTFKGSGPTRERLRRLQRAVSRWVRTHPTQAAQAWEAIGGHLPTFREDAEHGQVGRRPAREDENDGDENEDDGDKDDGEEEG